MNQTLLFAACLFVFSSLQLSAQTVSFASSNLSGESLSSPTSLQFGPDGRLYVSQQNGTILAYTVVRNAANNYQVTATETINLVKQIPNHDDNGNLNASVTSRQVTGILVVGTASVPIIFVTSSDSRIGGNSAGTDTNLDTNSGVISKLTKNGNTWTKVDLVRGLPRCEENHSPNGMAYDAANNLLYMAQGGMTNMGAPANNFAYTPEYAYSTAILKINLTTIGSTTYDLPTLDDDSRTNVGGAQTGFVDPNDPFGGNDGKNQAMLVSGGPVQIYSPGWRNNYDVIITQAGKMYSFDNGPNTGWGGTPVNCSNAPVESGTGDCDVLHYVTQGYYAGHANPTRGNRSNTFNSNQQTPIPLGMQNSAECTYQTPSNQPGAIKEICTSTNGLAEYTASNFSNAMKGDLLACGFNGNIYRFKLNAAGTALASGGFTTLASGLGSTPLDITTQGDNAIFPGTIWICTYGSNNIAILEPVDFSSCSGDMNSFVLDFDNDLFSNGDETANGTNPCSAASKPADFDNDHISNLTDPDDDNDGINDLTDKFARDATNGVGKTMPLSLIFDNSDKGGILGWGFTGLMTNGGVDYESLYNSEAMTVGGAAFKFTVDEVPAGDAIEGLNTQMYGFQVGVKVSASQSFYAHTRVIGPFLGITPVNNQSMGMFIGTGDEDNYLKIVTTANGGAGGIEVLKEESGSAAGTIYNISILNKTYVDLYFYINKATNEVQPKYSIEGGAEIALGAPVLIPASWVSNVVAVGFISTSINSGQTFPATWDLIELKATPVPVTDCNGVVGGTASLDDCLICSGGNTGHVANSDKDACGVCNGNGSTCIDCNGVPRGTAFLDDCLICSGGNTGHVANSDKDICGVCNGNGTTCNDCNGVPGGTAFLDGCNVCSGGNTGHVANSDKDACGVCFGNGICACQPNEVVSFTLMKAGTGGEIGPLTSGMTINLATIGSFSIRANTCNSQNVGSVKFFVNNTLTQTENNPPYAIKGDNPSGNYIAWTTTTGSKTVTATPYSGSSGSGSVGVSETVTFTVINQAGGVADCAGVIGGTAFLDGCNVCSGGTTGHVANSDKDACGVCFGNGSSCTTPDCAGVIGGTAFLDGCNVCSGGTTGHVANSDKDACGVCFGNGSTCGGPCQPLEVVSLTLVKAGTAGDIGPLTNGMTIFKGSTGNINVRANICPGSTSVKSVKFFLNGPAVITENIPPYAIAGDGPAGNYKIWNVAPGNYTVKATPYSAGNGLGTAGISYTVNITVSNSAAKTELTEEVIASVYTDETLKLYPNPNSGRCMIELNVPERNDLSIKVYNQLGQIVYSDEKLQFAGELKEQISLDDQPSGIYFLKLTSGSKVFNEKLVVGK